MIVLRNKKQKDLMVKLAKTQKAVSAIKKFGEKFKKIPKFSSYREVLGEGVAKLNDNLRNKFGIAKSVSGLVLLDVSKDSLWYSQGFMAGHVLLLANGKTLTSVDQLEKAIKDAKKGNRKSMFFLVQLKNARQFMSLPLE